MKTFFLVIALVIPVSIYFFQKQNSNPDQLKLYWFIPDGLRAEPDVFKIYEWAQNGELPNIKKMMDQGSYGYSLPVFPSHTPVNFAALLTGTLPKTNAIADGPMHIEGHPLNKVSINGFSSLARKIPAIWTHLEKQGMKVGIISTPGSTPPEIDKGFVIRGRWGNWGVDTPAVNIEYVGDNSKRLSQGLASRFFYSGTQLTQYVSLDNQRWPLTSKSEYPAQFFQFKIGETEIYASLIDSQTDKRKKYDKVVFSLNKKDELFALSSQEWSPWFPFKLKTKDLIIDTQAKIHIIKLDGNHFFRIRVIVNNLNETLTLPPTLAGNLTKNLGPMIDFVDNYPPQLINYTEDKKTFLAEQEQSFQWHTNAISYLLQNQKPNVVIHNIYNPNQMLTSRWWLGNIDPESASFKHASQEGKDEALNEVKTMYKEIDRMIGSVLSFAGPNTVVVLSSDHGVSALNRTVHLNNLFAKHKWLKFNIDPLTNEPTIDWKNTKVVFLKMDGIYLNPEGLDGNWQRAHGPAYEALRKEVSQLLVQLKDDGGTSPVTQIINWEDAPQVLGLPTDRVGDIIVANRHGYGWSEDVSNQLTIFSKPSVAGYKQAILADETKSLWTPFIIMGPGVKKNYFIKKPFSQINQLPTILRSMNIKIDAKMDGQELDVF